MKFLVIFVFGTIALSFSEAKPQGLAFFDNNGDEDIQEPNPVTSPPRPYSPLPSIHLPPHFQNQGISLPPPPSPPLHFAEVPVQYQFGTAEERLFFNIFSQFQSFFSSLLGGTTTTTTTTTPAPAGR